MRRLLTRGRTGWDTCSPHLSEITMSTDQDAGQGFSTRAIHHAYDVYAGEGALNPPVYLSATYAFPTTADGSARFAGEQPGYVYSRVGNPTTALLEARLANLEGGEAAVVTASGQGATTSLLWTLLSAGDEVIADRTLYGCTFAYLNHGLARFGVKVTHVDLTDPANLEQAIGPATKLVFFETPANPNMRLVDIAAVAAIARRHGARGLVVDDQQRPLAQQPVQRHVLRPGPGRQQQGAGQQGAPGGAERCHGGVNRGSC